MEWGGVGKTRGKLIRFPPCHPIPHAHKFLLYVVSPHISPLYVGGVLG